MTDTNLWLGIVLSGLPLAVAWLLERCLRSRAAVRSLRLRAALLASVAVALLPMLPMRAPRPSWLPSPVALRSGEAAVAVAARAGGPESVQESAPALLPEHEPNFEAQVGAVEAPEMGREPGAPTAAPSSQSASEDLAQGREKIVAGIWLGGALAFLAWSACCHFQIARLRRRSQVLAGGEVFEEAARVAREWKMEAPRLLLSKGIGGPFASGVWRASICWPDSMGSGSNSEPWRAILRHEMAHCRRRDCAWNALAQAARAMLWPQPMLWWACQAIRKNSEDVCDEAALEGCAPAAYARGLLDLSHRLQGASTCSAANRAASAGALPPQPELSRRVTRILKLRGSDAWRIGWRTRAATVGALCAATGASVLATSTEAPRAEEAAASASSAALVRIDLSSPQKTLDTFVAAVRAGDAKALSQCVRTQNSAEDLSGLGDVLRDAGLSLRVSPWNIQQQESKATARAAVWAKTNFDEETITENATLSLARSVGSWKITASESSVSTHFLAPIAITVADSSIKRLGQWASRHASAVLEGRLLLENGSPAAGARVSLEISDAERIKIEGRGTRGSWNTAPRKVARAFEQRAITDAQGRYRIEGLTSASYTISAVWPSTWPSTPSNLETLTRGQNFDAKQIALPQAVRALEGQTTQAATLKAQATVPLDVLTVDARDGKPLQGVLYSVGRGTPGISRKSGADGHAIINVPPGKMSLSLASRRMEKDVPITSTTRGDYFVRKSQIQLDNGAPIPYFGHTIFTVAPGKARRVTIRLMPYTAPSALPFRAPTASIERGDLTGRVQFEDGRPAPNVVVTAKMQSGPRLEITRREGLSYTHADREPQISRWRRVRGIFHVSARTDAKGNFRLNGLTTVPYDLMTGDISSGRWLDAGTVGTDVSVAVTGVQTRAGQTTRVPKPIVLIKGVLIHGRVTDKRSGVGIGEVAVVAMGPHRPQSSGSQAAVESKSDGSFELHVAPGRNQIYLSGSGDSNTGQYRIVDNGQSPGNFVLTLPGDVFYEIERYTSQLDGRTPPTQFVLPNSIQNIVDTRRGETHTLNFQLRRLRRATPEEQAAP